MKLIVQEYGSKITKSSNCLCVTNASAKNQFCAEQVEEVHVYPACNISAEAIQLCMNKNIWILFLDQYGEPQGEILPFSSGCAPIYKRNQLKLASCREGVEIVKGFLSKKLDNRVRHLKKIKKNKKKKEIIEFMEKQISAIEVQREKIKAVSGENMDEVRGTLQGYEGAAGRAYFECISFLLPEKLKFQQRRRNASDLYNCALNYLYGILYAKVTAIVHKCRLDPYIGIMHVDTYNKPTFVYDFIEIERIICEEAAFEICVSGQLKPEELQKNELGEWKLTKTARNLLTQTFYEKMNECCSWGNRTITVEQRINREMLEVAQRIGDLKEG